MALKRRYIFYKYSMYDKRLYLEILSLLLFFLQKSKQKPNDNASTSNDSNMTEKESNEICNKNDLQTNIPINKPSVDQTQSSSITGKQNIF